MIRLLIRVGIYLVSAAIGLLVAGSVLDGMTIHFGGFVVALVVFALAQVILGPFIAKVVRNNAEAFLGGVGLLSTFIALLLATLLGSNGLEIRGVDTWIAATVIVWLVTALATVVVPWLLVKAGVQNVRDERDKNRKADVPN